MSSTKLWTGKAINSYMGDIITLANLSVIVGLFITIGAPIIKLNSTIVKLNANVENIDRQIQQLEKDNHISHKRLWEKNISLDNIVNDHETRIQMLEK